MHIAMSHKFCTFFSRISVVGVFSIGNFCCVDLLMWDLLTRLTLEKNLFTRSISYLFGMLFNTQYFMSSSRIKIQNYFKNNILRISYQISPNLDDFHSRKTLVIPPVFQNSSGRTIPLSFPN